MQRRVRLSRAKSRSRSPAAKKPRARITAQALRKRGAATKKRAASKRVASPKSRIVSPKSRTVSPKRVVSESEEDFSDEEYYDETSSSEEEEDDESFLFLLPDKEGKNLFDPKDDIDVEKVVKSLFIGLKSPKKGEAEVAKAAKAAKITMAKMFIPYANAMSKVTQNPRDLVLWITPSRRAKVITRQQARNLMKDVPGRKDNFLYFSIKRNNEGKLVLEETQWRFFARKVLLSESEFSHTVFSDDYEESEKMVGIPIFLGGGVEKLYTTGEELKTFQTAYANNIKKMLSDENPDNDISLPLYEEKPEEDAVQFNLFGGPVFQKVKEESPEEESSDEERLKETPSESKASFVSRARKGVTKAKEKVSRIATETVESIKKRLSGTTHFSDGEIDEIWKLSLKFATEGMSYPEVMATKEWTDNTLQLSKQIPLMRTALEDRDEDAYEKAWKQALTNIANLKNNYLYKLFTLVYAKNSYLQKAGFGSAIGLGTGFPEDVVQKRRQNLNRNIDLYFNILKKEQKLDVLTNEQKLGVLLVENFLFKASRDDKETRGLYTMVMNPYITSKSLKSAVDDTVFEQTQKEIQALHALDKTKLAAYQETILACGNPFDLKFE